MLIKKLCISSSCSMLTKYLVLTMLVSIKFKQSVMLLILLIYVVKNYYILGSISQKSSEKFTQKNSV